MPWNPDTYNQFKDIRYQPFYDLMAMIKADGMETAVDIGCGTGEQTYILAQHFKQASFLGIDASAEMLAKSKSLAGERLQFRQDTVEHFMAANPPGYDLVFSNAALQWSDNHTALFPQLINLVKKGGQFAVQMPDQNHNVLNQLLLTLVQEPPFAGLLHNWKRVSPVLRIDDYAQIMFTNKLQDIQVVQKVYPIIAGNAAGLFDFIAGSALIPYMERLPENEREHFITVFKNRIAESFPEYPAMYAFKRILLYGRKD